MSETGFTGHQYDLFVSAHVVEAAGSQSPEPKRHVPKANAAIHVFPVKGTYSLVMRRMFNALLALSHAKLDTLPDTLVEDLAAQDKVLRFETTAANLRTLIGWDESKNSVYSALDALLSLQVVWDYTDLDNNERWRHKAPLLSQWGKTESGKVAWLWVPDLFQLLFGRGRSYTRLELALGLEFNSRYTLAVYENVYRYHRLRQTPLRPVDDWRLLFAGPGVCKDYREFKRQVLTLALNEIRETPTCPVLFELEEVRGAKNRVTALRFHIHVKPQHALGLDLPARANPALREKLLRLGVVEDVVDDLMARYDEPHLLKHLHITERKTQAGGINKPAAYFVRSVANDQDQRLAAQEELDNEHLNELKRKERETEAYNRWNVHRGQEAQRWFDALPEPSRQALHAAFYESANTTLRHSYDKHGGRNKLWSTAWRKWLCEQPGALASKEATDLGAFLLSEPLRQSVQ